MTTKQLFVRIKNHLSNNLSSSNSAIKSHRDQCKACRETIPAEQNFTLLKKCRFNTETVQMEALPIKRLKPAVSKLCVTTPPLQIFNHLAPPPILLNNIYTKNL